MITDQERQAALDSLRDIETELIDDAHLSYPNAREYPFEQIRLERATRWVKDKIGPVRTFIERAALSPPAVPVIEGLDDALEWVWKFIGKSARDLDNMSKSDPVYENMKNSHMRGMNYYRALEQAARAYQELSGGGVMDVDTVMLNNILGILNNWIFLENGMDPYTKPDLIDETNKAIKVLETILGGNVYYWRNKNDSTTH